MLLMENAQIYTQQKATVRIGSDLCDQEKDFMQTRMSVVKKTLETILGTTLADNEVPRIALCASGGGGRAAITTTGALMAAVPNTPFHILDICSHFAALSGSTWAVTGTEFSNMNPATFLDNFTKN